jgi:hypothetical protein
VTEAATILRGWPTADGWSFDQPAEPVTAAAVPASPPSEWFEHRDFPDGTPLTFEESGQVYGLLASRKIPHVGLPGQNRYAPFSASGYSWFQTGTVRCADGTLVATGRLTMLTGHADGESDMQAAASHYDNSGTAVADVIAFDRPDGVYCCGAARPELTPAQMRMAMASPPSGDWRPSPDGKPGLEMCAALLVNTAGFPQPRLALSASGQVLSLVAAGVPLPATQPAPTTPQESPSMSEQTDTPEALTAANPFAKDAPSDAPPADDEGEGPSFEAGDSVLISGTDMVVQFMGSDDGETGAIDGVPLSLLEHADEAMAASAAQRFTDRMQSRKLAADFAKLTTLVASSAETMNALTDRVTSQSAQIDQLLAEQRAIRAAAFVDELDAQSAT